MAPNFRAIFRNFRILWFMYQQHFGVNPEYAVPITQINPVPVKQSDGDAMRLNLLVPSLNEEHLFGGIATAVRLFEEIMRLGGDRLWFRIVVTDAAPDAAALKKFSRFKLTAPERDSDQRYQLASLGDKKRPPLSVMAKDRFFATAWWTAYMAQEIVREQSRIFDQPLQKMTYIIQDYEPAFYNWSSHFVLAEATYRSEVPTVAVFNSSLLSEYFEAGSYEFEGIHKFEPRLNETLQKYRRHGNGNRKRRLVCYGRPSTDRNCFSLLVGGLRRWVRDDLAVSDWEIVSVGEDHPPVELGRGRTMQALGKLSLEAYAGLMNESAIGLSLMASPHPSYPPLEMAHFGMLTITNSFFNKDLSRYHDNITSMDNVTPENVAGALTRAVVRFTADNRCGERGQSRLPEYCGNSPQFPFLDDLCKEMTN